MPVDIQKFAAEKRLPHDGFTSFHIALPLQKDATGHLSPFHSKRLKTNSNEDLILHLPFEKETMILQLQTGFSVLHSTTSVSLANGDKEEMISKGPFPNCYISGHVVSHDGIASFSHCGDGLSYNVLPPCKKYSSLVRYTNKKLFLGMYLSPDETCEARHGLGYRYRFYPDLGPCMYHSCTYMMNGLKYGTMKVHRYGMAGLYCGYHKICLLSLKYVIANVLEIPAFASNIVIQFNFTNEEEAFLMLWSKDDIAILDPHLNTTKTLQNPVQFAKAHWDYDTKWFLVSDGPIGQPVKIKVMVGGNTTSRSLIYNYSLPIVPGQLFI
ncbi:unnamed protein product [Acanthosepion pharaonis]|uniref:Uncharacterized protein n=1 Tax=Acanthosepion pharaonis TaxID=158019 RepID=A0A812AZ36_ACAPH|nr:unnamed protein product [Sepia pharaonis]